MLTLALAIVVLLILSAFFSGSETALTAVSSPMMHQMEQKGSRRAAIVNQLYLRKDRLIGAILLGNNLVNILASALATSALMGMFGDAGVVYATIGMTLIVLVFSEILPKTYAFNHANSTALQVAPLINVMVKILAPVTHFLHLAVNGVLKLFQLHVPSGVNGTSPEELRGAIELHAGKGESDAHERAMLRSVLDLSEVWVSEIMTHRSDMLTIHAEQSITDIVDQVMESPFTRMPVWRGSQDEVIGILHAKALLRALVAAGGDMTKLKIDDLASPPWFIPETTTLLDQLQAFRERHEHFSLVVDEYGALMGMVTLEDILEEIVGEISDEHDIAVAGVRPQQDGSYLVQGTVTLRDLNRELGWNLPDEEVSTVAGLVLHESRRIPDVGQIFLFHDFRFEILRRQRQRISLVRITPPANDNPE